MAKIDYVQPTTITSEELEKGQPYENCNKASCSKKKNPSSKPAAGGNSSGVLESGLLKKE